MSETNFKIRSEDIKPYNTDQLCKKLATHILQMIKKFSSNNNWHNPTRKKDK
jgi:transcriptional antiterminator